jgi:hypothetical protein
MALSGALFVGWVLLFCFADPPELEGHPAVLDLVPSEREDGRTHLGASWFQRAPGRSLLYVEGAPFELGYSNATLTADFLEQQERSLMTSVEEHFPSLLGRLAIATVVLVNNRNLPDYVESEYQLEILGLSSGRHTDPFPYLGPRYHRVLNYHAAHDISHWVWDKPVLGCTAFAARGTYTRDGALLVGRNFDWEAGEHFDRNKVIALYRPESGHAFLSVTWPGMAGVVTGLSEERIFCSINGAHSSRQSNIGRPVSLVVRRVLQYASDLDEAAAIIRDAPVFVSDSFLVADGETGEAIVVEKAPGVTGLRSAQDDLLVQSNHFESAEFAGDEGNQEYMREGTSRSRHARLSELLTQSEGELDVALAAAILRDRRGPDGAERGLGHRATLNPMIATHAVIAEPAKGILWVSRGPHQLGEFDAYSIEAFGELIAPPIPPDPALSDGDYERLSEQRALLSGLAGPLEAGRELDPDQWRELERARELNPLDPTVLLRVARAREHAGQTDAALLAYEACLAAVPPFASHVRVVRAALERLRGAEQP